MPEVAVPAKVTASGSLPTREQLLGALHSRRAGGYTAESVEHVIDGAMSLLTRLAADYDRAQSDLAATRTSLANAEQPSSEDAERLADEAKALFEETQATAANYLANARSRAKGIIEDANGRAERTLADATTQATETTRQAETAAQELTESTSAWAADLRESTEAEIAEARTAAANELEVVEARRDRLDTEARDIFERLEQFYSQQLEQLSVLAAGETTGARIAVPVEETAPVEAAANEQETEDVSRRRH